MSQGNGVPFSLFRLERNEEGGFQGWWALTSQSGWVLVPEGIAPIVVVLRRIKSRVALNEYFFSTT